MGLFSLLRGGGSVPRTDIVWQTGESKLRGFIDHLSKNRADLYIAWFEDTREMFAGSLPAGTTITMAKSLQPYMLDSKHVVFLEHYPLYSRESVLLNGSRPLSVVFMNSLEDALFRLFAGNIAAVMKKLGMDENEQLESSLITGAIKNTQKRIDKKVRDDFYVRSGNEWVERYRTEYGKHS